MRVMHLEAPTFDILNVGPREIRENGRVEVVRTTRSLFPQGCGPSQGDWRPTFRSRELVDLSHIDDNPA